MHILPWQDAIVVMSVTSLLSQWRNLSVLFEKNNTKQYLQAIGLALWIKLKSKSATFEDLYECMIGKKDYNNGSYEEAENKNKDRRVIIKHRIITESKCYKIKKEQM